MNKKGQGRKLIRSLQNPEPVQKVKRAIASNLQSVKSVIDELTPILGLLMHPKTLKRFLKNLVSVSATFAPVSNTSKWQLSEKKKKQH